MLLTKFPAVPLKEFKSQLSRWFSGAKDREGGKRKRTPQKMPIDREIEEDENNKN